jgi:autoinducer 2-degrading protein
MRKSIAVYAFTLLATISMLTLMPSREAVAQPAGVFINAVELDIAPGQMDKFMEAIKENGAAAVKEPGCLEFNISVLAKDPNHVFLYEVYASEAALTAHRATDHFKKYQAATGAMITARNVRAFTGVAFNSKSR